MNKLFILILLVIVAVIGYSLGSSSDSTEAANANEWSIEARDALIIGGYTDNFDYQGNNVRSADGEMVLKVDSDENSGRVEVMVKNAKHQISKDEVIEGDVKLVMEEFNGDMSFMQGGVAQNLWLHGDTDQGPPVMPKIYTFLAGWGPIDIYVDGELKYDDLDGHFMFTERARHDNKITDSDGRPYNPTRKSETGFTDPSQREFHIVAHTHEEDEDNFPNHTHWLHLNFQEVAVMDSADGANLFVPSN